jgi:hypothetical protein
VKAACECPAAYASNYGANTNHLKGKGMQRLVRRNDRSLIARRVLLTWV